MIERSGFIVSAAAAAAAAAAATCGAIRGEAAVLVANPGGRLWARGARTDTVNYQAYIDATAAQHQNFFDTLVPEGYRMISLDAYGDVGNERYAAVWVQRPGPAFVAINGTTFAGFSSFVNTYAPQGFAPRIFAVTGDAANQSVAAVLEQTYPYWYYYYGLPSGSAGSPGTFQNYDATFRTQNYLLAAAAVYGDSGNLLYFAAWSGNGASLAWHDHPAETGAA